VECHRCQNACPGLPASCHNCTFGDGAVQQNAASRSGFFSSVYLCTKTYAISICYSRTIHDFCFMQCQELLGNARKC